MKLGKYILGLALVAASLTSCDQDNIGAIYEPTVANISFMTAEPSTVVTKASSIEIPVALSRAIKNGSYTANVTLTDAPANVSLKSNQVTFADGEGIAYATVVFNEMEPGETYTAKVSLLCSMRWSRVRLIPQRLASQKPMSRLPTPSLVSS